MKVKNAVLPADVSVGKNGTFKPKKPLLERIILWAAVPLLVLLASYVIFTTVKKEDKVTYTSQQNYTAPAVQLHSPVSMKPDGWRINFTFSIPPGKSAEYEFVNQNTGDTVRILNGKFKGHAGAYYNLAAPSEFHVDKLQGAIMPINPLLPQNHVTVKFYLLDGMNRSLAYQLDSAFAKPESHTTSTKYSTLVSEEPHDRNKALKLLRAMDIVNSILPEEKRIKVLLGNREKSNPTVPYERFAQHYLQKMKTIAGSDKIFEDPDGEMTLLHEMIHGYFEMMGDRQAYKQVYERLMKGAGFRPYPKVQQSPVLFELLEASLLLALFDESNYPALDGTKRKSERGWSYANEDELFASTSSMLIKQPALFLAELGNLKAADPQQAEVALYVILETLKQWKGAAVFSPSVLRLLRQH